MMSSTTEQDPFLQVQQDAQAQLQTARPLFASYLRIRGLNTGGSNSNAISPELRSAREDLEYALAVLAEDLDDLLESVAAAERDPARFRLEDAEVRRRRRIVQEISGEADDMRDELAKTASAAAAAPTTSKAARAAQSAASADLPDPSTFDAAADPDAAAGQGDDDDPYYAEMEERQQQQMMRDQDTQLDSVYTTVGNLRRQADDMGRELEEQGELLQVTDSLADRVGGRLQTDVAKLNHVIRRNEDRYSGCCVALLITVLIVLLVLLLVL